MLIALELNLTCFVLVGRYADVLPRAAYSGYEYEPAVPDEPARAFRTLAARTLSGRNLEIQTYTSTVYIPERLDSE